MEPVENGSHNSTRLSMYIRDMPLTPFGMSPTSERKKKKKSRVINNTPGSNKLSRKNVKQTSSPHYDTSNKENEESPNCHTRKYYTEDIKSSLPSLNDHNVIRRESSRNSKSSKTSTTSGSQSKEIHVETTTTNSVCASSLQGNSENSHSSERRESVFTDIDDGSFIEFCDVQPKAPLYVPKKPSSSLYFTAESQNESSYSTSSKMSNAGVGFRKYVDAVKAKRALLDIVVEDEDQEPGGGNTGLKFLSDMSIVGGSADIVPKYDTKIRNAKGALNSTMIPTAKQPFNLPDISTLTLESEPSANTHSNNSSPAASPNYVKKQPQANIMDTITISESSDDESFMTANKSPPHEEEFNQLHDNKENHDIHKNKNHFHMELEATYASNISRSVKRTPLSESLMSEDVSIISSVAPLCKTKQFQSDATTVVYESVSVLKVPLRRSQRRSREKDEASRKNYESEPTTREFDTFRSKSPTCITDQCTPNVTKRKTSKRNSKKISESDNQANSSENRFRSPRENDQKVSESEDLSDNLLISPRSNTIHTLGTSNPPGSKHQIVHRERKKKTKSGKVSKVMSDSSEDNYVSNFKGVTKRLAINTSESENPLISPRNISKESLYVLKSGKRSDSDHLKVKITDANQSHSNNTKLKSDQESKSPLRKNKIVIEESDESSIDLPKKMDPAGKSIKDVINECEELRSDVLPVPRNTPNKYIWKIENNIPKKVLISDGDRKSKSPQVKQWIVKSPFKEGSFTSNFLLESNTQTISDSPSQPNLKKYNFKFKPCESSLKEKLDILDIKSISKPLEKNCQNVTPKQSIPKKICSPVETWVQTSPFRDSSLDSNFLLDEDNSYLSETPSQSNKNAKPNASSQSLKLRLSEDLDGSDSISDSEKSKYTLGRIARSPKDAFCQAVNTNAVNADQNMQTKRTSKTNTRVIDSETNADDSDHSIRFKRAPRTSRTKITVIDSETNADDSDHSIRFKRAPRTSKTKITVIDSETNGEDSDHSIRFKSAPRTSKTKITVIDSETNADDSDHSIKVTRTPRPNIRVVESDSETERTDNSLQRVTKKTTKNKVKQSKKSSSISIKKDKEGRKGSKSDIGDDKLKEIEKELNKMYKKDWHKNANAVLLSTKKPNKSTSDRKTKRPSHANQKNYKESANSDGSFLSDEDKENRKGSKSEVGDDELKEIEKELNKMYKKDWHKNANAVLLSTKKLHKSTSDRKTKRPSRANQKNYKESAKSDGSFLSDEAEEASDEELSVDEEEPEGSTLDSESDDEATNIKKSRTRDRIGSYISVEDRDKRLDETEQDGLDKYLARRKINKADTIEEKEMGNLDSYDSSFINDSDDDDNDSLFVLPALPQRLTTKIKLQGGSLSSILISDEISNNKSTGKSKPSKTIKNDKKSTKNVTKEKKGTSEVKKGKKLWSETKGPLTPLFNKKPSDKGNSSTWRNTPTVTISSDSDDYDLPEVDLKVVRPNAPIVPCWTPKDYKVPDIKLQPKTDLPKRTKAIRPASPPGGATPTQSFLSSLSSNINHGRCHPDAQMYTKNYKKNKEALSSKLYEYFNEKAFDNKLPESMQIKWNVRMTKTAGFCYYQIDKSKPSGRGARIELSSKVLDKPDRLRDTLVHEMCHAAAWIISAYKDGHGPLWKAWAAKVMIQFPELPAISRCHSYEISFKYTYKCSKCGYSIGRHSKSLDTSKKVCGYCFGKFDVWLTSKLNKASTSKENTPGDNTPAAPRRTPNTPNPFSLFVKENYKTTKQSSGSNLKHGDVMKLLSEEFKKMKAAT